MKVTHYGKTIAHDCYLSTRAVSKSEPGSCLCNWHSITTFDQSQLKCMKLLAFLLFVFSIHVTANTLGQSTVTLSEKNAPLTKIIASIEKQTGYAFMFESKLLELSKPITITVKKGSLISVLNLLFSGQDITYDIVEKSIIIRTIPKVTKQKIDVAFGNEINITGKIQNKKGEPLPGATIKIENSSRSTISNEKGEFSIKQISPNATIIISMVGYESYRLKLYGQSIFSIILEVKINTLDETQVVAYGTTTKRLSTGNVATVRAEDIIKQPVSNPLLALQGRVPGLMIIQSTGLPGSGVTVKIQGQNTASAFVGSDPLYVIDGVPYTSQLLWTLSRIQGTSSDSGPFDQQGLTSGTGNPLSFINPSDIESISILKDADATSIYGSRAANGAILITTKKGKTGKTKTEINFQTGWGVVGRRIKLLSLTEYLSLRNEALKNDNLLPAQSDYDINGTWDSTRETDWQKILIGGTAKYSNLQISTSGGTDQTQFLIGAGFSRESTVFPGNLNDKKGSVHFNITNTSINQKLRISITGSYLLDHNKLINRDITQDAIRLSPNAPKIYDTEGNINWEQLPNGNSTWLNPLAHLQNEYSNKTNNLLSNFQIYYNIIKGLKISGNLGYTSLQTNEILTLPLKAVRPESRQTTQRSSSFSNNMINSWIVEPQLSYSNYLLGGDLDAIVGLTFQQNNTRIFQTTGSGYNSDLVLKDITSAPTQRTLSVYSTYAYSALYSRLKYTYLNKYIISLSFRRDGSSRFGSKNQFNNFSSIATGWIFNSYSFIRRKLPFLSFGKIRASYGTTGNDQIGEYKFLNLYNPVSADISYQGTPGLAPTGLTNPYFGWEETRKLQGGLDLGFFSDKILINATYYRNRSSNQLLTYALPIITGFNGITRNFPAIIQNSGLEITVNMTPIKNNNLRWYSTANITIAKNKLVKFDNIENSAYANSYVIGKPITSIKVFNFASVNSNTGLFEFFDRDGNKTTNPDNILDRTRIINTAPKYFGGLQNTITYKGLEIDFLFQFVNQVAANYSLGAFPGSVGSNQPNTVQDRWTKNGEETFFQKLSATYPTAIRNSLTKANSSTLVYKDASYIRLKNISLSWSLSDLLSKAYKLQSPRLFIQGQNILTITKYKGLDPENKSSTTLPPLRVITIGISTGL